MALLNLPLELVLLIVSFLPKESDILSLLRALVNDPYFGILHSTLYTHKSDSASFALIWAVYHNRISIAKNSLKYGAKRISVDALGKSFTLAAAAGKVEILKLLIEWNGKVVPLGSQSVLGAVRPMEVSLLALAAEKGHLDVVKMLVEEFGLDVDWRDETYRTVLGRVVAAAVCEYTWAGVNEEEGESQQEEGRRRSESDDRWLPVVRFLLEHGADPRNIDVNWMTPLQILAEGRCGSRGGCA
ncbi:hypothetical protein AJ78_08046 [Emergomyces pasteurianus Ep9510]|uniref:F-box domain-containing protein n=1 Tax=Emergomyces pasteurianus Ep9510 TaxID=1447872 RepID=A0A1J9P5G6_9EURO|nr:hypothetical protein AJ78_08046 [Emergomyces pasteurianus Ep9510]